MVSDEVIKMDYVFPIKLIEPTEYAAGEGIDITNNVISLDLEEAEGQSV